MQHSILAALLRHIYLIDREMRMTNVPVPARAPLRGERVGGGAGVDRVVHQGRLLIQLHRPVHEAVPLEAPHHLPRPHDRSADVWRQRGHLLQRAGVILLGGFHV